MSYNTHRPNRTVSASGAAEGPLPSCVPRDEDHLLTPRNHRAEQLAAELERSPRLTENAPRSQSTSEEPSYVQMESQLMTPVETDQPMRQTLTPAEKKSIWGHTPRTEDEPAEASFTRESIDVRS